MTDDLARWLERRRPTPPPALASRMRSFLNEDGRGPAALLSAAEAALREVLEDPGDRDREAAYTLLAADALITYACEAGLETEDPAAVFEEVSVRVGRAGGAE